MSNILSAGTPAPDFTLHVTPDQTLSLKELRGRPVILAFYPADWSPVCGDQMALYNEILPEFHRFNAELMGISVDGVWSHTGKMRRIGSARWSSCPLMTQRLGFLPRTSLAICAATHI